MEFSELIRARYAVRAYQSRAIPDEALDRVVEAFVLAPTAANRQPIALVVAHTEGREEEISSVYRAEWFCRQPPVVACACAVPERAWVRSDGKSYSDVDVAIAMDHLVLAAANEGLGTCWIGAFDPDAAKKVFGLPEGVEPIVMTPLGYPTDPPRRKLRRPLDQIVHRETW